MDPDGSRFSPAVSAFVEAHAADDPAELLLARGRWPELDLGLAADCVRSRQKLRTKAPEWCREGVYCPLPLSAEQCSGEAAARYKAGLAARLLRERDEARLGGRAEGRGQDSEWASGPIDGAASGRAPGRLVDLTGRQGSRPFDGADSGRAPGRLADLTGGLGVDALAFSRTVAHVRYNERNPLLTGAAAHNFPLLTDAPVSISCEEIRPDNIEALLRDWQPDLVYMDPARRDENGRKVFQLEDCSPDVRPLRDAVLGRGATLLLKLSPMADISLLAAQLGPSVREVHVVEAEGECKELLFVLRPGAAEDGYRIHVTRCGPNASPAKFGNMQEKPRLTADHPGENAIWSFLPEEERSAQVAPLPEGAFATMQPRWMFLPGKALLKSGAFRLTASVLGLSPAGPSSHCYFRFGDDGNPPGLIIAGDGNKEGHFCAKMLSEQGDGNKKGPICAQATPAKLGTWWEVVCAEPLSKQAVRRFGAAFPKAEATVRDLPMHSEELQRKLRRSHSTAPDRPKTDGIHIFALRCALPSGSVPMLIAARRLFPDK